MLITTHSRVKQDSYEIFLYLGVKIHLRISEENYTLLHFSNKKIPV